jgi:hypothetical protein
MPKENPFYYNLPTDPADFVGRWPLVADITADLARPRADSWAVIGGRRFGKSSVLKAIEARLLERLGQAGQGERHIFPLIVDLKGSDTQTEQNVYARIGRLLRRALRRSRAIELDLAGTRLEALIMPETETLSFYQFEDILDDLALAFEAQHGPLRLVLMLDEVEATTRFDWSETLFNQLRALIYDGPLADIVKLVLTGAASVIRVQHEGSPLLNAVKIIHLACLDERDMQTLLARGGEIPAAVQAALQTQSGGHPFIAQYLLHHLWADGLDRAMPTQVEQVARQMHQHRAADLWGWWDAVADSGQLAYALLVKAADWLDETSLLGRLPETTQPLDQGLAALCYHGLAVRDPSRQRYRAGGTLYQTWFAQNAAPTLVHDDLSHQAANGSRSHLIETRENLARQLQLHHKSLAHLEEQKAQYGIDVPLRILHEIEAVQEDIERIETRLREIDGQLKTLVS